MLKRNEDVEYMLWARGGRFQKLDYVDDFTQFSFDLKWDDVSTWQLTIPTSEFLKAWQLKGTYKSLMTPVGGCGIHGSPLGIIVMREPSRQNSIEDALICGPICSIDRYNDGWTDTITVSGEDDTHILKTRQIWPDPSGPFLDDDERWWSADASVSSDDVTGKAESCASYYTQFNLGDWAYIGDDIYSDRRMDYFGTANDKGRGETTSYSGRLQTLLDACRTIVQSQPTKPVTDSFSVKQVSETGNKRIIYSWREAVDKTKEAIFGTDFGTIQSFHYTEAMPEANYTMLGGPNYSSAEFTSGAGTGLSVGLGVGYVTTTNTESGQTKNQAKRMFTDILNVTSAEIYGRIECFKDYSGNVSGDTGSVPQMLAIMADMQVEALYDDSTSSWAIGAEITLMPDLMNEFMKKWKLGDKVTADLGSVAKAGVKQRSPDHQQVQEVIREIKGEYSPDKGEVLSPTVSDMMKFARTPGATAYQAGNMKRRVSLIGSRQ